MSYGALVGPTIRTESGGLIYNGVAYTKQEVWAWLKAENHYHPPKEELRPVANRAARRRSR